MSSEIHRNILPQEKALLEHLLSLANDHRAILPNVERITVLQDGEMGSIRFSGEEERKYGRDIIQVQYIDTDNQLVLITLIEDDQGELYELEFWKVDFNPLLQYPTPDRVVSSDVNSST